MHPELDPDIESLSPAERYERMPRPLNFVRVRLFRDGQAEYIKELLEDEQDDLLEQLTKLRVAGKPEDDTEVAETRQNLRHIIRALSDVTRGLIDLVGPDVP
jgi:hypothetical protein